MKITRVVYDSGDVAMYFPDKQEGYNCSPVFTIKELENFRDNSVAVSMDGYYTMKRTGNQLIIWKDERCVFTQGMDVSRWAARMIDIPRERVEMDIVSFQKRKDRSETPKTWVDIMRWVDKPCLTNIVNAHNKGWSKQLKPYLARLIDKAKVYPDGDRENMSFYFDGRYEGGFGMNGGIIFHGGTNGYSSHT